jgi:hypothetical protein
MLQIWTHTCFPFIGHFGINVVSSARENKKALTYHTTLELFRASAGIIIQRYWQAKFIFYHIGKRPIVEYEAVNKNRSTYKDG